MLRKSKFRKLFNKFVSEIPNLYAKGCDGQMIEKFRYNFENLIKNFKQVDEEEFAIFEQNFNALLTKNQPSTIFNYLVDQLDDGKLLKPEESFEMSKEVYVQHQCEECLRLANKYKEEMQAKAELIIRLELKQGDAEYLKLESEFDSAKANCDAYFQLAQNYLTIKKTYFIKSTQITISQELEKIQNFIDYDLSGVVNLIRNNENAQAKIDLTTSQILKAHESSSSVKNSKTSLTLDEEVKKLLLIEADDSSSSQDEFNDKLAELSLDDVLHQIKLIDDKINTLLQNKDKKQANALKEKAEVIEEKLDLSEKYDNSNESLIDYVNKHLDQANPDFAAVALKLRACVEAYMKFNRGINTNSGYTLNYFKCEKTGKYPLFLHCFGKNIAPTMKKIYSDGNTYIHPDFENTSALSKDAKEKAVEELKSHAKFLVEKGYDNPWPRGEVGNFKKIFEFEMEVFKKNLEDGAGPLVEDIKQFEVFLKAQRKRFVQLKNRKIEFRGVVASLDLTNELRFVDGLINKHDAVAKAKGYATYKKQIEKIIDGN